MEIVDVVDPQRVDRAPDKTIVLMSSGGIKELGNTVNKIQLNLYLQQRYPKLGPYSLFSVFVETD